MFFGPLDLVLEPETVTNSLWVNVSHFNLLRSFSYRCIWVLIECMVDVQVINNKLCDYFLFFASFFFFFFVLPSVFILSLCFCFHYAVLLTTAHFFSRDDSFSRKLFNLRVICSRNFVFGVVSQKGCGSWDWYNQLQGRTHLFCSWMELWVLNLCMHALLLS